MKYTELYTFKITNIQKKTLQVLHKKYKINISKFIRDAIKEKILREKAKIVCSPVPHFDNISTVEKYRLYYRHDKPFAKWGRRGAPEWFIENK